MWISLSTILWGIRKISIFEEIWRNPILCYFAIFNTILWVTKILFHESCFAGGVYLNESLSIYSVRNGTGSPDNNSNNNSNNINDSNINSNNNNNNNNNSNINNNNVHNLRHDIKFKREMEINFPGSRISSFAWCPTEERKILLSLVREHLLRPGFFLRSSELAVLNESGLVTIKRWEILKLKIKFIQNYTTINHDFP